MSKKLPEALLAYSQDRDEWKLLETLASVTAGEPRIDFAHFPGGEEAAQFERWVEDYRASREQENIGRLLLAGEFQIGKALTLLDARYRYGICGQLRKNFSDFSAQDLADIWQDVLLALWRKALERTLEFGHDLEAVIWAIADRQAKDLYLTRNKQQDWEREQMSADTVEIGRRWQMLTGLQQEEVRDLIWAVIEQLPAAQRTVWQTYFQYLDDHCRPPTVAQLTEALSHTAAGPATDVSVDDVLQRGHLQTRESLRSNGYDICTSHDEEPSAQCESGISKTIDGLVIKAFVRGRGKHRTVPDLRRAESFLTDADRSTLEELPPDLATRAHSKYHTLRMWRSPLWSDRMANRDTYLPTRTVLDANRETRRSINELISAYNTLLHEKRLDWAPRYHFVALLGEGGQGAVYLVRCPGFDGFSNPLALKIFAPDRYTCLSNYLGDARRMARMASIVADIHHPNVLDVVAFENHRGVRMMLMEWVDGYDLGRLMVPAMLERLRERASPENWRHLCEVIVKEGPNQPRLRPFIAVAIIQSCLAALEKMHERGIVHGDIKPSNIMLTRNGFVKLIDIGSAFAWTESPIPYHCTCRYAAPEVLQGGAYTPQSDLASLGYVLVELLSGRALFADVSHVRELLEAKIALPKRLAGLLPERARREKKLVELCRRLVEPDPGQRFASACDADLDDMCGSLALRTTMIKANLGTSPEHDISHWLKTLG